MSGPTVHKERRHHPPDRRAVRPPWGTLLYEAAFYVKAGITASLSRCMRPASNGSSKWTIKCENPDLGISHDLSDYLVRAPNDPIVGGVERKRMCCGRSQRQCLGIFVVPSNC